MNENPINGVPNPGKKVAILGFVILCASLASFFIRFAEIYASSAIGKQIITFGGFISMLCASFIASPLHDTMTILASVFGFFVILGIIKVVSQSNLTLFKIAGAICIILLGMNNYIYYTEQFLVALPLLQKITFVLVFFWVLGLNRELTLKHGSDARTQ